MQIERLSYLSNFEELINEFGVGIQHVFGDGPGDPGFCYTGGLFEADHPEFIAFGFPPELGQAILNDLADAVLNKGLRFEANDRVHQLFRGAAAHLMPAVDSTGEYLPAARSIRDRRYPKLAGTNLDVLHLVYEDAAGRWPWEPSSDYFDWPRLASWPSLDDLRDITIPRES